MDNQKLKEVIGVVEYEFREKKIFSNHEFVDAIVKAIESKFILTEIKPKEFWIIRDDVNKTTFAICHDLEGAKRGRPKFPIHTIYHAVEVEE